MSFLQHFGFREYPFGLTPNANLFFSWQTPSNILEALTLAVDRGEGIIKVTGEIGTGKTMICRLLLGELTQRHRVAYINSPFSDTNFLPYYVCQEFGLSVPDGDNAYAVLWDYLIKVHGEGKRAVLVIDEAQALGVDGMEIVRLLSNLETDTDKLLQIVLFGQPELDRLLALHPLRQVRQRITFSFNTRPLSKELTRRYIEHRVSQASALPARPPLFSRGALRIISKSSGGAPRVINILADKSLIAAYSCGAHQVTARHAKIAVSDSRDVVMRPQGASVSRWLAIGAGAAAAAVAALWVTPSLHATVAQAGSLAYGSVLQKVADMRTWAQPAAPAAAPVTTPPVAAPATPTVAPTVTTPTAIPTAAPPVAVSPVAFSPVAASPAAAASTTPAAPHGAAVVPPVPTPTAAATPTTTAAKAAAPAPTAPVAPQGTAVASPAPAPAAAVTTISAPPAKAAAPAATAPMAQPAAPAPAAARAAQPTTGTAEAHGHASTHPSALTAPTGTASTASGQGGSK